MFDSMDLYGYLTSLKVRKILIILFKHKYAICTTHFIRVIKEKSFVRVLMDYRVYIDMSCVVIFFR